MMTHHRRLAKEKIEPMDQSQNLWLIAMGEQDEANRCRGVVSHNETSLQNIACNSLPVKVAARFDAKQLA
jgi:hypothetical protein